MSKRPDLSACEGFDWDEHNIDKVWDKHGVSTVEFEEVFFNRPLVVRYDFEHSAAEERYFALGATDSGRRLFTCFTLRGQLIRPISARDMTDKESGRYERHL